VHISQDPGYRRREPSEKFKKVGIFPSSQSWERATYLVWHKLKTAGYAPRRHKDTQTVFTPTSWHYLSETYLENLGLAAYNTARRMWVASSKSGDSDWMQSNG